MLRLPEKVSDKRFSGRVSDTQDSLHGNLDRLRLQIVFVLFSDRSELVLGALGKNRAFPGVRLGDVRDGDLFPLGCGNTFDELARSVHFVSGSEQKIEVDLDSW